MSAKANIRDVYNERRKRTNNHLNLPDMLAVIIALTYILTCCFGSDDVYTELKDCDHEIDQDDHLITVCELFARTQIITGIFPKKTQGLLIVNHMRSARRINCSSNNIRKMYIEKVIIKKINEDSVGNGRYKNLFSIARVFWQAFAFVKSLLLEIDFNDLGPEVGLVYMANTSESNSSNDCSRVSKVLGDRRMLVTSNIWKNMRTSNRFKEGFSRQLREFTELWNLYNATVTTFELSLIWLAYLPRDVMDFLSRYNMLRVNFHDSNFKSVGTSEIWNIGSLRYLGFSQNSIEEIDNDSFENLRHLEILNLTGNHLTAVPETVISLPSLKVLDMSNNVNARRPFNIGNGSVHHSSSSSVKIFYLNGTPLIVLNEWTFTRFPRLEYLNLRNCSISAIHSSAFDNLTNLKYLDVSVNRLKILHSNFLRGLIGLRILNMANSEVELDESLNLNLLPNLRRLHLEENGLKTINFLSEITNETEFVNVTSNLVESWQTSVFSHPLERTTLLLKRNKIKYVYEEMIADFRRFGSVDINFNPFDCDDCSFRDFQLWIQGNNTNLRNISSYMCHSSDESEKRRLLDVIINMKTCTEPKNLWLVIFLTISFVVSLFLTVTAYFHRWYILYYILVTKSKVRKIIKTASNNERYLYHAFVCYSEQDRPFVIDQLIPNLEQSNDSDKRQEDIKLCIHERNFLPGEAITDNIIASIDSSQKVLLILSNGFVDSRWCLYETHLAQHRMFENHRDSLIIVKMPNLQKVKLPRNLNYLMNTRTHLEWTDEPLKRRLFWFKLRDILCSGTGILKFSKIP
ncbi:Uncharacterised protein g8314 [Pycnogonum litorale]